MMIGGCFTSKWTAAPMMMPSLLPNSRQNHLFSFDGTACFVVLKDLGIFDCVLTDGILNGTDGKYAIYILMVEETKNSR